MISTLRKNTVMQGCVDFYCLSCEQLMRSKQEADNHVEKQTHVSNLQKIKYVDGNANAGLRKVNTGYYCEKCDILLPSRIKRKQHIKENKHVSNISNCQEKKSILKRTQGSVVSSDVLIGENAWNGFIDGACVVCYSDVITTKTHNSTTAHIIKLFQTELIVADYFISREINEHSLQCLTCNKVISSREITAHIDTSEHLKRYLECRTLKDQLDLKGEPKLNHTNNSEPEVTDNFNKLDIKEDKKIVPESKSDETSTEESCKAFADANDLTFNVGFNKTFCRICNIKIPANLKNMREHVNGAGHTHEKSLKASAESNPPYETQVKDVFVKNIVTIATFDSCDMIVNGNMWISMESLLMWKLTPRLSHCLFCDAKFPPHPMFLLQHFDAQHKAAFEDLDFVSSLGPEFIRVLPRRGFHCGICNSLVSSWEKLLAHINSDKHKTEKLIGARKVQKYQLTRRQNMDEWVNLVPSLELLNWLLYNDLYSKHNL